MKKLIGTLCIIAFLGAAIIGIYAIWQFAPVHWSLIGQIILSIALIIACGLMIGLCVYSFFKKNRSYDYTKGSIAHPKKY